jgi:lipoprotein NlpI
MTREATSKCRALSGGIRNYEAQPTRVRSGSVRGCVFFVLVLALVVPRAAKVRAEDAAALVSRGVQKFRNNDIAGSLADFDRAAELDPKLAPQLWQRGIADYYAGKYREGRRQFELHQTVNPHDVENAAWHFLCVVRLDGLEAAQKSLLKVDKTRDTRVPMPEIYDMLTGQGSPDYVLNAATRAGTPQAAMYANLYVGLFYEAIGDKGPAQPYIRKAAATRGPSSFMRDVAKVHLRQRHWDR